jgi:predicted aspartyl protease
MSRRVRAFGALFVAASFLIGMENAASADDCHPLTLITSVDLIPTTNNTWQFVPVTIQGTPKMMLLDTGGAVSEVTPQVVDELGLSHRHLEFQQENVAGETSDQAATVSKFEIGRLSAKSIEFVIAPEKKLFGDDNRLVGIIAPNILRNYDVDIDFGAHKLSLLSPDHCEGKVIYWPASAVAVVPMHVLNLGHIVVTVKLNGQDVRALVDTGASNSTLMRPTAESDFGLKMGSADTPYLDDLQGKPGASIYRHRFATLSFGDITVSNPQFDIIPDFVEHPLELSASIGSHFVDPNAKDEAAPMLLGMNVLRHLHLYIAYKEQKLYITPGGVPAPQANPGGAAATAAGASDPSKVPH